MYVFSREVPPCARQATLQHSRKLSKTREEAQPGARAICLAAGFPASLKCVEHTCRPFNTTRLELAFDLPMPTHILAQFASFPCLNAQCLHTCHKWCLGWVGTALNLF